MARAGHGQMQQYIQQETQKQQMQVWRKCPFSLNETQSNLTVAFPLCGLYWVMLISNI